MAKRYSVAIVIALVASVSHGADQTIRVAKSNGAKQCEFGSAITPDAMRADLTGAGIAVSGTACGGDGMAYPAVCGAGSGGLNIFEIALADLEKAKALGFAPLSNWPDASETTCPSGKALTININGIGPAVDGKAYKKVRLTIGNAVTEGVLDKFIVHGHAIEGGFFACVEASSRAPAKSFDKFTKKLRAIRPNPNTTAYSVEPVDSCS